MNVTRRIQRIRGVVRLSYEILNSESGRPVSRNAKPARVRAVQREQRKLLYNNALAREADISDATRPARQPHIRSRMKSVCRLYRARSFMARPFKKK